MRPGVTSYATIYNGYTDTMDKMLKRLEYDLDYLDNRNIFTDLGIIFKTVFSVFSGKKF
jgi:lipopolysaccharide/colanic/teichoic acid biosynthesis glycosyltransferase